MGAPLNPDEIRAGLEGLRGWTQVGEALRKDFRFGSFREAMSFMVRVAFEAEAMNHHPDWTNVYNRVEIRLNTHDAGDRITGKDLELARRIEKVSWID